MEDSDFEGEGSLGEEEEEEEQLDPNNPEHYFPIIERDFNKTLANLEQNPEAHQFTDDFNKLFESFFHTYTKQKELEEANENLKNDIADKDNKIELALKLADEDQKTIAELRKQINNAWRLADDAHAREQLAHEIIDNLRRQVENLNAEIEFKNKMSEEPDETGELSKHRDGLERERDRLINEVNQLNTKLQNAVGYQEELEKKNSEADLKINEIAGQLEDQVQETNRQKRAKEKLETDIQEFKFKLEEKDIRANELNETIKDQLKQIAGLQKDVKEWKLSHDKLVKDLEATLLKSSKLSDEHNTTLFEVDSLKKTLQEKAVDLKIISEETTRYKNDLIKAQKARDVIEKKVLSVIKDKEEIMADRNYLRQRISMFQKEIEDFKRYIDEDKRTIETIVKEKDVLNKTVQRHQVVQKDQQKLIQIQEQAKKKLEVELDLFFIESEKHKKLISQLERDRDRLTEEQLDLTNTIQDQLEDIRQKKVFIFDLKKEADERENKIKQQQNVYEAMRSDKNALQKLYQESTAETGELKKKLRLVSHQIEQLKENIGQKEKQIIKDESIVRKLTREKEQLKIEVMTGLDQVRVLRADVKELHEEEKRLCETITSLNRTIREKSKDLDLLMNERDVLGSQLVRRNDEIALLNEKIVILQATLARGETHYELRLTDIRLLKLEIKRLRQEKGHIDKTMASMVDLRLEVFHLERDLTKCRLKCKALEQEVQNPLNIHRWRKLAGSDPEVLDLLQKIQILQKRLLQQGSIAIERERQLKQVERLYLNLRKVVARQPGPSIQEELGKTQRALKNRGNKLKCMVSELNMADLKVSEYKSDLERVTQELADLKKKYLAEKKANRTLRMAYESSRELSSHSRVGDTGEVKFTGGGFRMSVSQVSTK